MGAFHIPDEEYSNFVDHSARPYYAGVELYFMTDLMRPHLFVLKFNKAPLEGIPTGT